MSMSDVTAEGWELLGRRDPPGQRPSLHTLIEATVFRKVSAVFPDVLVTVSGHSASFGLGPEIVIRGKLQRFNRTLDYNMVVQLDRIPQAEVIRYASAELARSLSSELMRSVE